MRSNVKSIQEYLEEGNCSPTACQLMLAGRLKYLREHETELTGAAAAKIIGISSAHLSRLESGQRRWSEKQLLKALRAYGYGSARDEELVRRLLRVSEEPEWTASFRSDALPKWFEQFVELESVAEQIRSFETRAVHGLLQCHSYAQAVIAGDGVGSADVAQRRLALRRERQRRVFRQGGPTVWVVLEEAVLKRRFAEPRAMREQLLHLKSLVESNPRVKVQILPDDLAVNRPSSAFTHLKFNLRHVPDKVYIELPHGALYQDSAGEVEVQRVALDNLAGWAYDEDKTPAILDRIVKSF
ncbi:MULTISPECIES: helix-turn-helix domain-containing protein [Streptomyces]|uniref:helix-turn-helix domain-containing protein n=1 Tax=Streptomyces TaxID=1883 RepID=UPI00117F0EE3|nr:helix-turn-helix transcriptional regulator [Streptomyces kasugaensis]